MLERQPEPRRLVADVVVVGAGAGGAALAAALGQRNWKVLLIDRRKAAGTHGADTIKPSGVRILDQLGILDQLFARGAVKRDAVQVFHNAKEFATIRYPQGETDGYFVNVPYEVVVATLHERLQQLSSVTCLFGAEVRDFHRNGKNIERVDLVDGRSIEGRVFIGADGARSIVREELGFAVEASPYEQRMFSAKFRSVQSIHDCNRLYVDDDYGLAYFYPIGEGHFRALVAFRGGEAERLLKRERDSSALKKRLLRFVSMSEDAVQAIDDLAGFAEMPMACMHSSYYGCGNTLLLGDAIHSVHPMAGQGVNLALEDAAALSMLLTRALEGELQLKHVLPFYLDERFSHNNRVVMQVHCLATTLQDPGRFRKALGARLPTAAAVGASGEEPFATMPVV